MEPKVLNRCKEADDLKSPFAQWANAHAGCDWVESQAGGFPPNSFPPGWGRKSIPLSCGPLSFLRRQVLIVILILLLIPPPTGPRWSRARVGLELRLGCNRRCHRLTFLDDVPGRPAAFRAAHQLSGIPCRTTANAADIPDRSCLAAGADHMPGLRVGNHLRPPSLRTAGEEESLDESHGTVLRLD